MTDDVHGKDGSRTILSDGRLDRTGLGLLPGRILTYNYVFLVTQNVGRGTCELTVT